MKPQVNIVVTCTKRKRIPPSTGLKLRDVQAPDQHTRFVSWLDLLRESEVENFPARRLYAGDHWSVVKTLEEVAATSGFEAILWVCSAGYGLISLDSKIKPYSATFSSPDPDTVCQWNVADSRLEDAVSWWQLQNEWLGPDSVSPRSIAKVAANYPDSPLLVVASRVYLGAIVNDVQKAVLALCDPDLLCIISTGTNRIPGLDGNLLPSSMALQGRVGGSALSLNIRLARTILAESTVKNLRASCLKSELKKWVAAGRPLPRHEREAITDQEVQQYIAEALTKDSEITWGSLLCRLRDGGRACGQERFSSLFQTTKAEFAFIQLGLGASIEQ